MLCFNKLTGEHNAKKILDKIFVLWEYIFKLISFKTHKLICVCHIKYCFFKRINKILIFHVVYIVLIMSSVISVQELCYDVPAVTGDIIRSKRKQAFC